MKHCIPQHHLVNCTLALALGLSTLAARAGDLVANASRNPIGLISNNSPGSSVSAYWPDSLAPEAWGIVTRTSVEGVAHGAGSNTNMQASGGGNSWTGYTLWDLGANAALDGGTAATLDLNFVYRLQGATTVQPVGTSVASASYLVELYSGVYHSNGANLTVVYGPVPPFPSEDYAYVGDTRLAGAYDFSFSVLHENAGTGFMWMAFNATAAKASDANGLLTLTGITLADGAMPAGGLGVRLETGQIITVSAVPEPATWLMWAGAGLFLALRHLRPSRQAA